MRDDYFQNEGFSPVKALLGLLTFSTILPLNVYTSIEYMTRLVWCWPFLHFLIGFLALICGYVSLNIFHYNLFLTAVLIYAFLMLITGYNHLDGVMDMADGLMVHGNPDKKISVVKDSSVGAGGIATLFLVASLTIGGIYNILDYNFLIGVMLCEMMAKTSLLTTALTSKPLIPGIGSYFVLSTKPLNYSVSTVAVIIISYFSGGFPALMGVFGAVVSGLIISLLAKRNFGVVNGDVLGMSNEVGRLFALLFMLIGLYFI